jgi:hypothetical protein
MMTELPWQLWILVGEVWLSAIIGSYVLSKPVYKYTWRNIGWAFSDLAMIALLIWGGNPSWQHLLFGSLYAWAIINRTRKTINGTEYETKGGDAPEGLKTFFIVLFSTALTLLIVTG